VLKQAYITSIGENKLGYTIEWTLCINHCSITGLYGKKKLIDATWLQGQVVWGGYIFYTIYNQLVFSSAPHFRRWMYDLPKDASIVLNIFLLRLHYSYDKHKQTLSICSPCLWTRSNM